MLENQNGTIFVVEYALLASKGNFHYNDVIMARLRLELPASRLFTQFPAQMASYAENVSIRWRHHEIIVSQFLYAWMCRPKPENHWTYDVRITPLLRQNDTTTSFWLNNDDIITFCAREKMFWWSWNISNEQDDLYGIDE